MEQRFLTVILLQKRRPPSTIFLLIRRGKSAGNPVLSVKQHLAWDYFPFERNNFAKGMTLPERLSSSETTTREYEIGDFGYWNAGPDLAIFYDDIYEQTIVEVIPLGHAEAGAETMRNETGTVRLELLIEEGEQTENE